MRQMHLGIIPDGNRRWASERGLAPWDGHRQGAKVMEECLKWCLEEGIEEVSIYSLSMENLIKRPEEELKRIFDLLVECLRKLCQDDFVQRHEVRVRVLGRTYKLPDRVIRAARKVMKATRGNAKHFLNVLVAYGGQDELLRCVQMASRSKVGRVTRRLLEKCLWVPRPLDLIIRTGGDHRLSNFMLYQSSYAEIIFVNKFWPDFTREDFTKCLEEFDKSERRMGA